jgi:hypothetical protein
MEKMYLNMCQFYSDSSRFFCNQLYEHYYYYLYNEYTGAKSFFIIKYELSVFLYHCFQVWT